MKLHIVLPACVFLFLLIGCADTDAQPPSPQVMEKVMKGLCNCEAEASGGGNTTRRLKLNSVKFASAYRATAQEVQVEGIPAGLVYPAMLDWTERAYYNDQTRAIQRVRGAKVFKDRFGEWTYRHTDGGRQDVTTTEPAQRP